MSGTAVILAIFITLGATAIVVYLRYRSELRRARDVVTQGSVLVNIDEKIIEYAERGLGPPLLSIHGAGGGFDQGLVNASAFVGDAFRIIAPSRFGYLRTPVPQDISPAAQADAHAALLSKLNVPKAVVVGVSAGARSAVELALRHPGRVVALILIVPGLYAPTRPVSVEGSRASKFVLWVVNAGGGFIWWAIEKIAPSVLIRFVGVPPALAAAAQKAERDQVMRLIKSVEPLSLRFRGINIDSTPTFHELPLEKIDAPTLVVSARDDLFNTLPAAEFAAARISTAKLIVYDHGGHLLVGHRKEVRKEIQIFLGDLGLRPAPLAVPPVIS